MAWWAEPARRAAAGSANRPVPRCSAAAQIESDGQESEAWDDDPPWTFDPRRLDNDDTV